MLNRTGRWNRRQWLASSGIAAAAGFGAGPSGGGCPAGVDSKLYESLGSGLSSCARHLYHSDRLAIAAEVKEAMVEASRHFVHLDELMDAVGARIAELTKRSGEL